MDIMMTDSQTIIENGRYPLPLFIFLALFSSGVVIAQVVNPANTYPIAVRIGLPVLLVGHLMLHWYGVSWPQERTWLAYVIGQVLFLALLTILSRDPGLWLLLLAWLLGEVVGTWKHLRIIIISLIIYTLVGIVVLLAATGWEITSVWLGATLPTVAFTIIGTLLYKQQVMAREEAQELVEELAAANQQITIYAQQVERLTLAHERQRMARELHDTLAQGVAGMIMQLEAASIHLAAGRTERTQTIVQDTMSRARTTLAEARAAIDDLRSQEESIAFDKRLAALCTDWQAKTGIGCQCRIELKTAVSHLTSEQEEHLERVVTEALANITKHAAATAVTIQLQASNQTLTLTISDNGQGFDIATVPQKGHYGLRGLQERARLLSSQLTIDTTPGQGTTIQIQVPL